MLRKGILKDYADLLVWLVAIIDIIFIIATGIILYQFLPGLDLDLRQLQATLIISALLAIIIFSNTRVYLSWRGQSWFSLGKQMLFSWSLVFMIVVLLEFFLQKNIYGNRIWYISWYLATIFTLTSFRFLIYLTLKYLRTEGKNRRRIAIFGAGVIGNRLVSRLNHSRWSGFHVQVMLDDNPEIRNNKIADIDIKQPKGNIKYYLDEFEIDELWITLPLNAEGRIKEILHELRHETITVRFIPDIFGFHLLNHSMVEMFGYPIINISETPLTGLNRVVKTLEDFTISAIILILISPIMLLLAIGVKLSSPGPVFFRQERLSWNGKPFEMLKFRSMPVNVENETGAVWAKPGESRATKFGAFLRKTSLDELPQFINVLKGDMSIVGPRPERPVFVEQFKDEIPGYMKKHMVKAGITGWAQVNGWRGDTDLKKRIDCDLYYINNWSLWFDIKIIILTVFKGFINKNAY